MVQTPHVAPSGDVRRVTIQEEPAREEPPAAAPMAAESAENEVEDDAISLHASDNEFVEDGA